MNLSYHRWAAVCATIVLALCGARAAHAELLINEIFWDAGGSSEGANHAAGSDFSDEYVELRGTPGMSLSNYYLIFLENENNQTNTGHAGEIDNIFNLGNYSIGSNGFLTIREKNSRYDNFYGGVAPGTTDVVNTGTGDGFGNGASSSIGHTAESGKFNIENGGWTAMIIRNDGDPVAKKPTIGQDLDVGNNGLDSIATAVNQWRANWTILDSIGVHGEGFEPYFGRTYSQLTFGTLVPGEEIAPGFVFTPNIEPGATYVAAPWLTDADGTLEREIEYMARWGNSTGNTADDWLIANVTQKSVGGSVNGAPDYRVSADVDAPNAVDPPPAGADVESNHDLPYRASVLHSLGQPNYPIIVDGSLPGDYNEDGKVDALDYTVWRNNMGKSPFKLANEGASLGSINDADFDAWKSSYGGASGGAGAGGVAVPEPAALLLAAIGLAAAAGCRSRKK